MTKQKTKSKLKKRRQNIRKKMSQVVTLSDKDKRTALEIARYSLESVIRKQEIPDPKEIEEKFELSDALKQVTGVFVTLRSARRDGTKTKNLRGCVGYVESDIPIYEAITHNAFNASCKDYRFPQVQPSELSKLSIVVSVMSPLVPCTPDDVVVGRDGLVLENGDNFGIYLPQFAVEGGWDRIGFLENVSVKAGLDKDKWKDEKSVLYHFTAQVFSEDDFPDLYKD